ncbi:MAG: serine/threonine protein kinase [Deltaproteobacteria bacterium]|nr:serine/threonine protein kinase [Deltaproteobacteria bacterium]
MACWRGVSTGGPETIDDELPERTSSADMPRRIGRYLVIEVLGQGAMGIVYAAFDPDLSRKLAIKLLHHREDSPTAHSRLVREAQALARLSHANVVQIYDVGTHEGAVFVAMELVQGRTLRRWRLDHPDAPWDEILGLLRAVGRGLAAAHDRGIVHRDVKPDNVLVGDDGSVRVVDFGLARAADGLEEPIVSSPSQERSGAVLAELADETASDSLGERMTRTGARLGTPAYMAPEQWTGGAVDARTDQFAFCVLAWEALYGERPFGADNLAMLGYAITHGEVRMPATTGRVPAWVQKLLLRGLQREPPARHPDLHALVRGLERDPARSRRHVVVGVVAAGAILGSAWLGASLERRGSVDPCATATDALAGVWDDARRSAAATAFTASGRSYAADAWSRVDAGMNAWAERYLDARHGACEATQVRHEQSSDALDLRMACLDRQRDAFDQLLAVFEHADADVVDGAARAIAALPVADECADAQRLRTDAAEPDDPELRARVDALRTRMARARALHTAGRYDAAAAALGELADAALATDWAPLRAELRDLQGSITLALGDAALAEALLRDGLWTALAAGRDHAAWSCAVTLASALAELPQRAAEARSTCELADAERQRLQLGPRAASQVETTRFRVEVAAGDYAAARAHIERAIALREQAGAVDDVDYAGALANLGTVTGMMGDPQRAAELVGRAVELRERVQAPGHPAVARELHNLGSMFAQSGRYDEARPLLERALVIKREALGERHPDLAYTHVALGNVAVAQDRFEDAEQHLRAAIAIDELALGVDHPNLAYALLGLGDRFIRDGHPELALPPLRRALAIREAAQGPDHPEIAYVVLALGVALLESGDAAAAIPPLERGRVMLEQLGAPNERADIEWPLARARWQANDDRPAAVALARAAREHYREAEQADNVAAIDAWLSDAAHAH